MTTFRFKSSGKTLSKITDDVSLPSTDIPLGIVTPVQLGYGKDGIFMMHRDPKTLIRNNLKDLILTNKGERLMLFDFGGDLRTVLSDYATQEDFDSAAIAKISTVTAKWMPFVELKTFVSNFDEKESDKLNAVKVLITYDVPNLGIFDEVLQVTLYAL